MTYNFSSIDQSCPFLRDWGASRPTTVVSEDLGRTKADGRLVHNGQRGPDGRPGGHVLPLAGKDDDDDDDDDDDGDDYDDGDHYDDDVLSLLILAGPHLLDKPQNREPSSPVERGPPERNSFQ